MRYTVGMPLAAFDWTADVLVPIILSLTIGVTLSIYTGLVASRMFAFYQARARAVLWSVEVTLLVHEKYNSFSRFALALHTKSMGLTGEFKSLGHDDAHLKISALLQSLYEEAARTCGVELDAEGNIVKDAGVMPQNFAANLAAYLKTRESRWRELGSLRPDWWEIVSPFPLPEHLGPRRGDGSLKTELETIGRYLLGTDGPLCSRCGRKRWRCECSK